MDSLDGLDVSVINDVDILLLLNSRLLPKADIYLILFSLYQFCMVAHNCHGKTKNLTAKTKRHSKTKNLTAKTKYLTAKPKTSRQKQNTLRQNQKPQGKTKYFTAKTK